MRKSDSINIYQIDGYSPLRIMATKVKNQKNHNFQNKVTGETANRITLVSNGI